MESAVVLLANSTGDLLMRTTTYKLSSEAILTAIANATFDFAPYIFANTTVTPPSTPPSVPPTTPSTTPPTTPPTPTPTPPTTPPTTPLTPSPTSPPRTPTTPPPPSPPAPQGIGAIT